MAGVSEPVKFPDEEPGMPGVHIDIKHDLGSGGDPHFSGSFHGAGSGGAEPVDEHTTGLAKAATMGLDKAAGVERKPGTAGAHPAMVGGGGSGVGAGEGPGTGHIASTTEGQGGGAEAQPTGTQEGQAPQSAKEAMGMQEQK